MIISHEHNYLFVSNPKACTHTMYSYLVEHYGGKIQHKPGGGVEYHPLPAHAYPDLLIWTIVRSPYSRAVALWWQAIIKESDTRDIWRSRVGSTTFVDFCAWLANRGWDKFPAQAPRPQAERLSGIRFDVIIHIENLTAEFAALPFVGNDAPPIPRLYESEYGNWRDSYAADGIAAGYVREWAESDFTQYEYPLDLNLTGRPTT